MPLLQFQTHSCTLYNRFDFETVQTFASENDYHNGYVLEMLQIKKKSHNMSHLLLICVSINYEIRISIKKTVI